MKLLAKFLLAAVLFAGAGNVAANPYSVANGRIAEIQDRHLTGFNGVHVAGSFDVILTQGPNESVKVEAPSDVIDRVKTDVEGGVLKIYNKHDDFNWGNWWGHSKKIVVYVTAKDINSINISGSGDVSFRDGIKTNSLKLKISGSGDMKGHLEVKNLESSISGSGDMSLEGRADNSSVSLVGSGDYRAHNLQTAVTSVRVSGSGDAGINVSQRLDASVNGSGDVHYTGGPKTVNKSKSGSGDISGS